MVKTNFSPNQSLNSATGIPFGTPQEKIKYTWNCMCSGDYKRTNAITKLYENLYKAKNIDTINILNLEDASFYTGDVLPNTNWSIAPNSFDIEGNAAYPSSQPRNLGEHIQKFERS